MKQLPRYIQILEYARDNSEESFSFKEIKDKLNLTNSEIDTLLKEITHNNIFFQADISEKFTELLDENSSKIIGTKLYWETRTDKGIIIHSSIKFRLSIEGYNILQEYYDLKESRENAINAQKLATLAILISIFFGVISATVGIYQLTQSQIYNEKIQFVNTNHSQDFNIPQINNLIINPINITYKNNLSLNDTGKNNLNQ